MTAFLLACFYSSDEICLLLKSWGLAADTRIPKYQPPFAAFAYAALTPLNARAHALHDSNNVQEHVPVRFSVHLVQHRARLFPRTEYNRHPPEPIFYSGGHLRNAPRWPAPYPGPPRALRIARRENRRPRTFPCHNAARVRAHTSRRGPRAPGGSLAFAFTG